MRTRFRRFRWTRPFWGGLWLLSGGAIMAWLPLSPITDIVRAGLGAVGGVLLGLMLLSLGVLTWLSPSHRKAVGFLAILIGLVSYPVTNFGGFVVGMLLAIVGGAMACTWTSNKPKKSPAEVALELT